MDTDSQIFTRIPLARMGGPNAPFPNFLSRAPRSGGHWRVWSTESTIIENKIYYDQTDKQWHCTGYLGFRLHGLVPGRWYRAYAIKGPLPPSPDGLSVPYWNPESWPPPHLHYMDFKATKRAGTLHLPPSPEEPFLETDQGLTLNPKWSNPDQPPRPTYAEQDTYFACAAGIWKDPETGAQIPYPCIEFDSYAGPEGGYDRAIPEAQDNLLRHTILR